jgi:NADPH2:quinone reductase
LVASLRSTRTTAAPSAAAAIGFAGVASGNTKIEINQRNALKDVGQAHRDLESRKTTGSTVLVS